MAIFAKLKNKLFGKKNEKYDQGLKKSRLSFTQKLKALASKHKIVNQEYFDELEEILISADVGHKMAMKIVAAINQQARKKKISEPAAINEIIVEQIFAMYTDGEVVSTKINFNSKGVTCVLVVGVNGSGKTTTLAKLAYRLKAAGKKPLLVAADTFRAGAVEQLKL